MATNQTAFEAPMTRFAWYCASPINKYEAVQLDADGNLVAATAATLDDKKQFLGVCQYGSDRAGEMVTVVGGAFPVVANEAITAGQLIEVTDEVTVVNDTTYHTVKPSTGALTDAAVIGTALTAAGAAGDLVTVLIK